MKKNRYPPGWNERRVRRLIAYYKSQTEAEAIAEAEAAFEDREQTMMGVPNELAPKVRELIVKHKSGC